MPSIVRDTKRALRTGLTLLALLPAPLISLVGNLSSRRNIDLDSKAYADFKRERGNRH